MTTVKLETTEILLACRICLATDVDLFGIFEHRLDKALSDLIGSQVWAWDGRPRSVCGCCRALLLKAAGLRDRARRAESLLLDLLAKDPYITTDVIRSIDRISHQLTLGLSTNVIDQTPIDITFDDNKDVIYFADNADNADNADYADNADIYTHDEDIQETHDVEDVLIKEDLSEPMAEEIENEEIPKKVLRKRRNVASVKKVPKKVPKEVPKEKKDVKVRQKAEKSTKKKGFKRFFSCEEDYIKFENNYNICIVKVSEEEQRREMELRKESANYARAHLRCGKCHKGFLSDLTYDNHQKVHDPSMGANECQLCFARFKHPTRLRRHMETHTLKFVCKLCPLVTRHRGMAMMHSDFHSGKTFECKYCGLTFKKKTTFNTHVRVQHPLENAARGTCDVCGETFIGRRGLQQHKTMAHRKLAIPELRCAACGVQFESLDAVVRHAPPGGCDPKRRACPQCGETFAGAAPLARHLEAAHVKPVYKCDDCDKSFATRSSLGTHVDRVHLRIKLRKGGVYKHQLYPRRQPRRAEEICEVCGKGYPNSTWLKYHQRIHTGERPYKCPECPKSYMTPAALQSHSVTHTGERRWQCSQCPKTFLHQSSIYKHRLVHTGEKPYECSICSKTFTQSGSLSTHVKYVHMKVKPPPRRRRRDAPA